MSDATLPPPLVFDDECDYAVGVCLPNLKQRADDLIDDCEHFTESQARDAPIGRLPVRYQHDDDKSSVIGIVDDTSVEALNHRVLLRVDPRLGQDGIFGSNALARGIYPALSLSHRFDPERPLNDDGSVAKSPYELSLVDEPWRPGANIEHVFPARSTLERLSDEALRAFVQLRYADRIEPPAAKIDTASSTHKRYIQKLWQLVRTDRDRVCRARQLLPAATSMSATTATLENAAAALVPPSATALDTRASASAHTQERAAAPAAAAAESQMPPPTTSATDAFVPGSGKIDLKNAEETARRLLETEEAMVRMQQENAGLQKYRQQVEQAESQKQQAAIDKANTALESLAQYLEQNYTKEYADSQRATLRTQIESNPHGAYDSIEQTKQILVKASEAQTDANRRAAEAQAQAATVASEARFAEYEARRRALATGHGFDAPVALGNGGVSTPPPVGGGQLATMTSRFAADQSSAAAVAKPQPSAVAQPPPSAVAEQSMAPVGYGEEVRSLVENSSVIEVRASMVANHKRKRGWAREAFSTAARALTDEGVDRTPTYKETGLGVVMRPTGDVRAGANGQHEIVLKAQPSFTAPQRFGMGDFAPVFFDRAMDRLRGRTFSILDGDDGERRL